MNRSGYSIVEAILAAALSGIVLIAIIKFLGPTVTAIQRGGYQQRAVLQSRSALETIGQALQGGVASSVRISTPNTTPMVPNSRIEFGVANPLPTGTTGYTIGLTNGSVYFSEDGKNFASDPRILARNVSALIFTGSYLDPAIVHVTLLMATPTDSSMKGDSVVAFQTFEEEFHMVTNP